MVEQDRDLELTVEDLVDRSDLARRSGAIELALKLRVKAIDRLRELADHNSDNPHYRQVLAAGLYAIGQIATDAGLLADAVDALDECEAIYEELGEEGVLDPEPFACEVSTRRARALSAWGKGASAVIDIDRAVRGYRKLLSDLTDSDADPQLSQQAQIDLARALTAAAVVQFRYGDPDLAVAAAESAVKGFLDDGGPRHESALVNAGSLAEALVVAEIVHAAHSRHTHSNTASDYLRRLIPSASGRSLVTDQVVPPGGALVDDPGPLGSTLARALDRNGDRVLAADVTLPAVDYLITVPSERVGFNQAPSAGIRLARAALTATASADKLRIALEAHWLLAAASETRPLSLRSGFRFSGGAWISALRASSDELEATGDLVMALDVMSWAAGVAQRLTPFAYNPTTARLICDCFEHHADLLEASGDPITAGQARDATEQLRRLYPHDSAS